MITETNPTLDEWRALYEAMNHLKEIAPWQWMEEGDLFGVQNPEIDELGFVSVMGQLGEHLAVSVYLGAEGLYRFWEMQYAWPYLEPEMLLNTPQLQASFEDRNDLHKQDRDVIKQLGLKYRGQQAWPQFQSYAPGMAPWFLTAVEARFLRHALEQTVALAPRLQHDPDLLSADHEEEYLIRVPQMEKGKLVWHDEVRKVPPPEPKEFRLPMDPAAMAHLEELPQTMAIVDVDFFWMPAPIGERGQRPYYPYTLLLLEPSTGMVLGAETVVADPTPEDMWAAVPMRLVQTLANINLKPKTIRVFSPDLAQFLRPLADRFGWDLKVEESLPQLENAKASLIGYIAF